MRYSKPEIVFLSSALAAVQSGSKTMVAPPDGQPKPTSGAYEADE